MFCTKCGEAISDGSEICPKCGADLREENVEQSVVYASQKETDAVDNGVQVQKKFPKVVIIAISAVVCVGIIAFAVFSVQKANLKKALVKEWYDVEGSIIKVLDIDDDEMQYRLETGYRWMDTTLGTYDWKVVSGNKIKIKRSGNKYKTYTIKLNDDKDVLKISPAITSTDSSETWYHVD